MKNFIKINRSILDWEWYGDSATKSVFLHLLLTANYHSGAYKGMTLEAGQAVFGRKALAEKLGLTERQVRTALSHLEKTGEVTIKTTNKFSIATIEKWGIYQAKDDKSDQQNDQDVTKERPYPRNKESKNIFIPPSIEEVQNYCTERRNGIEAEAFVDYYTSTGWMIGKNKMRDWKAAIRTWERKQRATEKQDEGKIYDW